MIQNLDRQQLVLDTFCQALTDPEPQVRAKAAESLGRLEIQAALPNLLAQLSDPTPLVRLNIIRALGNIRSVERATSHPRSAHRITFPEHTRITSPERHRE